MTARYRSHIERAAIALKGAANSCTRGKHRDCLTDELRAEASVLRARILALLSEAREIEERARQYRIGRREKNSAGEAA